jgi:hypothetical protein
LTEFVICGLEHSGTTLISELLRQVPGTDAGFEVGVLLGRTPREFPAFQPFAAHMLWGWGLNEAAFQHCCDTDDFTVFYDRLMRASTKLRDGTVRIFDKTPRYGTALTECMAKQPVPFIVACKDPRSTVYSDFKSSGQTDFDHWFAHYAREKLGYMRLHYAEFQRARAAGDPRLCVVRLEDLCLRPRETCARMFAHVGAHFHRGYLAFRAERYENTRAGSITAGAPFEYINGLGVVRSQRVMRVFAEFNEWFFD